LGHHCHHLHPEERDVLEEAARRVRQHEILVADVLPDLVSRLERAEAGKR